jgi:DNA-binding NtrC family response regulator
MKDSDSENRVDMSVLLIADGDVSLNKAVGAAVARTGRRLWHVKSNREAYPILSTSLERIAAVIIDWDSGTRGLSILEAISFCRSAPPVVVIVGANQSDLAVIASRHGAAASIRKPLNASDVASVIDRVCLATLRENSVSSDGWGHPLPISRQRVTQH